MRWLLQLMLILTIASVAGGSAGAAATASGDEPSDVGPPPDWTRYKALGEAAVRALVPGPQTWSFEWPNGYANFGARSSSRWHGWTTCGVMRTAEPARGRPPVTQFIVVVDHDQVRTAKISGKESNSMVNVMCADAVRAGRLPPAAMMHTAQPISDAMLQTVSIPSLGIRLRAMPEGGYVDAVAPGSSAAAAGLIPGMMITRVNTITLAGMGTAMTNIVTSDQAKFDIETATGQHLTVTPIRSGAAKP